MIFKIQILIKINTKEPDSRYRTIGRNTLDGEYEGIVVFTFIVKINEQFNINGLCVGTITV
jgi:hypothetical protein